MPQSLANYFVAHLALGKRFIILVHCHKTLLSLGQNPSEERKTRFRARDLIVEMHF